VCLDLLKDNWSPAYTLEKTVEAVAHMLANPGIDSPLNVDVAALLRTGDAVGAESLVRWAAAEKWGRYEGK
jgi:peroxin-4